LFDRQFTDEHIPAHSFMFYWTRAVYTQPISSNCHTAHIQSLTQPISSNCYTAHVHELPHSPHPVTVQQWLYILGSSLTVTCAFLYWCSDEWEWLKRQSTCRRTLGCASSETLSSVSGDEHTGSEEETSDCATEQQRVFVELVAATARRLFSYMEVSPQEALTHRLGGKELLNWYNSLKCSYQKLQSAYSKLWFYNKIWQLL